MKVILYMATSVNGFIAKTGDDTSFVSETEWKSFREKMNETGNLIIGSRTFVLMEEAGELPGNVEIVVVSHSARAYENKSVTFVDSPNAALALLEQKRFTTALVGGGGKLNTSFLEAHLIDEMYLDIEPAIVGEGISLFSERATDVGLTLLDTKKLSDSEIQLHYKIEK